MARLNDYQHNVVSPTQASMHALSYVVPRTPSLEGIDPKDVEAGLGEYWAILRNHAGAIVLSTVAGLVLGFCIGLPFKPVYRANTMLEFLDVNGNFMNLNQADPIDSTRSSDGNLAETEARLMQSAPILKRVVAKLKKTSSGSDWSATQSPEQATRTKQLAEAARSVKVELVPRTRLFNLSVDSTDPKLAANFANTLAQEFIQHMIESRWQAARNTSQWLGQEVDEARRQLEKSEDQLQAYASQSGLIFTDGGSSVATERLQQVQDQLSQATTDRIAKQARLELVRSSPENSLADILSDPDLRQSAARMNDLRGQIADLQTVYSPGFSKVRRVQAQLDSLQLAFEQHRAGIVRRIESDYNEASRKERLLAASYDQQTNQVTGQGQRIIQYNIRKREVDSNRQRYDAMLQQLKQSSLASAMHAANIRIAAAADLPSVSIFPKFKINALLGLLTGLFLSGLVVVVRERSNHTLRLPGDIRLWADLVELGNIPSASIALKGRMWAKLPTGLFEWTSSSNRYLIEPAINAGNILADAFRSTVASLLIGSEDRMRPRIVAFTSAHATEGKTTIVSNLAIASATLCQKVLIIDADLRRPCIHKMFKLQNECGLGDLILGANADEDLRNVIQKTHLPGLDVLTAGLSAMSAVDKLHSPVLGQLLSRLIKQYDLVLIDTPPTLHIPDARFVGRFADGVVLVARANRTNRVALAAVQQRFAEDRIRVIGSILNDWDPRRAPDGYHDPFYYTSRTRS